MDRRKRASDAYRRVRDGGGRAEPAKPLDQVPSTEQPALDGFEKTSVSRGEETARSGRAESPTGDPDRVASLLRGSGPERAARLMMAIGPDRSAEIMRLLDPDEVEAIASAIVTAEPLRRSELEDVLAEASLPAHRRTARGGPDTARAILVAAFGRDEGERRFFRSVPNAPAHHFAFMNDLEPAQLQAVVKGESPAAAALIIAHVSRELAAEVFKLLPPQSRSEIARRIARMGKLSRDVVVRVEEAVREKIRRQGRHVTQGIDGPTTLTAILRHMGPSAGDAIVEELRAANLDLGESIREKLYTTELLHDLTDRHLADLLREFSDREIALFLKGKDESLRARVLRALSERRGASVSEEYAHLGPQARDEVDRVTREILDRLRELEEAGSILVPREGDRYI